MQEQLAKVVASLESAQAKMRALTDRISDRDFTRRPALPGWSAADCVEHLNLTSAAFLPLLRDAIARAREMGRPTQRHYRRDPLGWFLSKMMAPLRHFGKVRIGRVKTLPPFEPKGHSTRESLLSDFVKLQSEMITVVRSADGLPIDRVKIVSPFGGRMRYNTYAAFVVIEQHQHRHLQQAEEAAIS